MEKQALSLAVMDHGTVLLEHLVAASEEEKRQNRDLMKKLIRSLYFLVKHHIPYSTTFVSVITFQIGNGDVKLLG